MKLSEYASYDALGLADLVRRREVSAHELATAALGACEKVNPALNAVIAILPDWERQVAGARVEGPFGGVPFLIKDLVLHAEGVVCDSGSRLVAGAFVAPADSDLMQRFRRSGVALLGRTNTPEFGFNASTEPVLHGATRNPWDVTRSPGGSSGGSAAAVAAGVVPIAHANDGGGSIRIPASACGLVGLKPTRGRTPVGPDYAEPVHGLGIEHVVARSVRDVAAMLDAVEGPGVGDRYAIARPVRPYLDEVGTAPQRLRIAVTSDGGMYGSVDPACVAAVRQVADQCASLGHIVEEAAPRYDEPSFHKANLAYWASFCTFGVAATAQALGRTPSPDNVEATIWANYQYGLTLKAIDLEMADALANQVCRAVGAFYETYDVLLSPTIGSPPYPLGTLNANDPRHDAESWYRHLFAHIPFTALYNLTGQPAISLPLCWSGDGLPIGVQAVGRLGDEATLLNLAGQLEHAMPWRHRLPRVHVSR